MLSCQPCAGATGGIEFAAKEAAADEEPMASVVQGNSQPSFHVLALITTSNWQRFNSKLQYPK